MKWRGEHVAPASSRFPRRDPAQDITSVGGRDRVERTHCAWSCRNAGYSEVSHLHGTHVPRLADDAQAMDGKG